MATTSCITGYAKAICLVLFGPFAVGFWVNVASEQQEQPARHFPSLPDAVTAPPGWIGKNVPFDLTAYFEAPPSQENAAPLYLDAFSEFDDDVVKLCYPEEAVREKLATSRARRERLAALLIQRETDSHSVDNATIDALLSEYETGFRMLAEAQRRDRCVFETGVGIQVVLPHASGARSVADVVELRTERDLARGDIARPIHAIEILLRLSRDLRPRGESTVQLASLGIEKACWGMVRALLSAPGLSTGHCDQLLRIITTHEAEAREPWREMICAEYLKARKLLYDLQHRRDELINSFGVETHFVGPLLRDFLIDAEEDSAPSLAVSIIDLRLAAMTADDYAKESERLNKYFRLLLSLTDQNYRKRTDALAMVLESVPGHRFLEMLSDPAQREKLQKGEPDQDLQQAFQEFSLVWIYVLGESHPAFYARVFAEGEAMQHGTQCLIALRRWQLKRKVPPADLATIVKNAGMAAVPVDPFSGEPLRMTTMADRPVIYSVGPNGRDDGGLLGSDNGGQSPRDLVFWLEF